MNKCGYSDAHIFKMGHGRIWNRLGAFVRLSNQDWIIKTEIIETGVIKIAIDKRPGTERKQRT